MMRRETILGPLLLLLSASGAAAQYAEFRAAELGRTLPGARPSVRLGAMGGLSLVVRDENRELNLSDFSRNLAGIAADRQGWTLESWGGLSNNTKDRDVTYQGVPIRQRDRFNEQAAGCDVVYRREGRRALGVTMLWTGYDVRARYGPNSRVRGPGYHLFYNETFGRLAAAVGVSLVDDSEDVVSRDIFAIRHVSRTRTATLAAAYAIPLGGLTGAVQVDFDRVRIEGVSADPAGFHRDEFDWRRPTTRIGLSVLRPDGAGPLSFGVNCSLLRRTGREEAEIRWADRFPQNPGRVNFSADVPTFEEEEDGWLLEGRMAWRPDGRLTLAGALDLSRLESRVTESTNSNFVGSRRGGDTTREAWQATVGAGLTLREQRLRLGAETAVRGETEDVTRPRASSSTESRRYDLRAGGEYLLPSRLALRLGYQRRSLDSDLDLPSTLLLSNGGTFGVGYTPRGAAVALDLAARLWQEDADQEGGENWKAESADLQVSFRFLF